MNVKTPIGIVKIPDFQIKPYEGLSDGELLETASKESKEFTISPALFAIIEKKGLYSKLQQMINPNLSSVATLVR
jgi:hypothetical protein